MPRFVTENGVIETADPSTVVRLRTQPGVKEEKARTAEVRKADAEAEKAPKN